MMTDHAADVAQDEGQRRAYRRVLSWLVLPAAGGLGLGLFWAVNSERVSPEVRTLFIEHFSAIVGLPGAASAALFIVMLLEQTHGPIEFEAAGFKFRGASGPVVLWVFCYLAIVTSIKLLW
jgi:hypothetical protein